MLSDVELSTRVGNSGAMLGLGVTVSPVVDAVEVLESSAVITSGSLEDDKVCSPRDEALLSRPSPSLELIIGVEVAETTSPILLAVVANSGFVRVTSETSFAADAVAEFEAVGETLVVVLDSAEVVSDIGSEVTGGEETLVSRKVSMLLDEEIGEPEDSTSDDNAVEVAS